MDYWAEFLREMEEGMVGHVGEEMEVTHYRERWWRWRPTPSSSASDFVKENCARCK